MVAARVETAPEFYGLQYDFLEDERRYVAFVGGRNSGKTYAGSWKAVLLAQKGGLGVIAAPDFPMLEHGARRQFMQRLRDLGVAYTEHRQKGTVSIPGWSAEVLFATLETESRVRGPNFRWGWVDEVEYLGDAAVWQALKGAVREGDLPQLFVTSTPKGRRLIYDEWVVNATEQHALYRATTRDNPYIDSADYIAGLGYTGRFAQQEIEAEFVSFEGLVYPEFDRTRQVAVVDTEGWTPYLGVDVGSRNPTAILTLYVAGDGRLHVGSELYRRNMSASEIVAAIAAEAGRVQPAAIWVDPSAKAYLDDLTKLRLPAKPAVNDVLVGIGRVASALPRLTVDPACANLLDEFEGYRFPEGRRAGVDAPVKEHDHALDALRYAVMGLAAPRRRVAIL